MYKLLVTAGVMRNSEGEDFEVDYRLIQRDLIVRGKFEIKNNDIEMLDIIKVEQVREDSSYRFTEFGAIIGITASFGAFIMGRYKDIADVFLGFGFNIIFYAILFMIIGLFIKQDSPYYTFKIRYIEDESTWTIKCHKVMYDVFENFSINHKGNTSNSPASTLSEIKNQILNRGNPVVSSVVEKEEIDNIAKLEKYYDLLQKGVISEEEFSDIKRKILNKESAK